MQAPHIDKRNAMIGRAMGQRLLYEDKGNTKSLGIVRLIGQGAL